MADWTRRKFLRTSLVGGGAVVSSRLFGGIAPAGSANEDVRVAVVGVRSKGNHHLQQFKGIAGCRVVAVCDVDAHVLARRVSEFEKENNKVTACADYRKLLDDPSIDAVVLATPNHWHALQTIWACQAGKDVYVEKPISHNIWEGRKCVEAARKYNRIVQAGTQSRSAGELHQAFAYIRAGHLGKILWARALCYKPRESIGKTSGPQPVPPHIDYDLWSGFAPLVPPRRNSANGTVHYDWHWFWPYGGGEIANQAPHQLDICRWFLGEPGLPPTVMSIGGRFGYDDDAETPNTQIAVFGYERAPLIVEVRGLPAKAGLRAMDAYRGIRIGAIIQCEGGCFAAGESGGGFIYDNDGKRIKPFTGAGGGGHAANFIAAVRSRKSSDLNAPIEEGHVSTALCHLANISHRLGAEKTNDDSNETIASDELTKEALGRMIEHLRANQIEVAATPSVIGPRLALEPEAERFVTKQRYDLGFWANTLLTRHYRKPFVVPESV